MERSETTSRISRCYARAWFSYTLALFILLAGCVTVPERLDPFAGVTVQTQAYPELVLGLVLSENTKKAIRYAQEWEASRPPLGPVMDGDKVFDRTAEVFRNNFKEVKRVETVEDAKALGADLVVILDMYLDFPNAHGVSGNAKIDVNLLFVTANNNQIDRVQFEAVGAGSIFSSMTPVRDRIAEVTEDLMTKLKESIKSSPKLIAFSKAHTTTVVAAKPQASQALPVISASDVDRLPSFRAVQKKHAYAVVIGIEQYREKLPKADFADKDAKLVGEYLTKVLGYPEENVIVRLNERATRTDLVKYFEEWLKNNVEPGGSVFVYYSGHGAPNTRTGEAYLVPYDGDPSFVDSTAYPVKQMYAALDKLPAKDVTVVLDSCFSGAGGRSVLAKGARPMVLSAENPVLASGKTIVLAASGGDQISNSFQEQGHGLLTYYFLKGLQGEGDTNKDGVIEMAELYDYVKPNVQRIARKQYNSEQTPQLLANPELLRKGGGRLAERAQP